jgi:hypothetical protein
MDEFSSVDIKRLLIGFVGNAISYFASKHHLTAVHIVEHYVFEYWLKSDRVDEVKVNFFISGDLNSLVSFNEVNHSPMI